MTVTTAEADDPVSLSEIKAHLGIADSITTHDTLLAGWIKAAAGEVKKRTRRSLITRTLTLTQSAWPDGDYLELLYPPVASISSVKYYDTSGTLQTWSSSNYELDADHAVPQLHLAYGVQWPATRLRWNAVQVQYVAGYGADETYVPWELKAAIMLRVKPQWEERGFNTHERMAFDSLCDLMRVPSYP